MYLIYLSLRVILEVQRHSQSSSLMLQLLESHLSSVGTGSSVVTSTFLQQALFKPCSCSMRHKDCSDSLNNGQSCCLYLSILTTDTSTQGRADLDKTTRPDKQAPPCANACSPCSQASGFSFCSTSTCLKVLNAHTLACGTSASAPLLAGDSAAGASAPLLPVLACTVVICINLHGRIARARQAA